MPRRAPVVFAAAAALLFLVGTAAVARGARDDASPLPVGVVGPDAAALAAIPNAGLVFVNGHRWPNPLRSTPRGSSAAAFNAFGTALAAAGNTWTAALCAADSDGDGFTNGEEMGDPNCVWTPGAAPARSVDITHPGVWSSVPTTAAAGFPSSRRQTYDTTKCTRSSASIPNRDAEGNALRTAIMLPTGFSGVAREAELAKVRELDADTDTHFAGSASVCPHTTSTQEAPLVMWHDAATWGSAGVPAPGKANVVLPEGKRILVTTCSLPDAGFGKVTVPATTELIFDDAPVHLKVKELIVRGALRIGSKACPIKSPVTITFVARKSEAATYGNGLNVFDDGVAELHGWTQDRTWTRLKATATAGSTAIVTLHPTTWAHGDEVVIVTSIWKDTEKDENEVRRIVARDSANSSVLLLDKPLQFKHYAGHEYQSEVALLTRTILLRGGLDDESDRLGYGGHTWAVGSSATYRMVGVRADRMGQRNVMARYPFHFHMMHEGGSGNYIQQCAVTNSYFRGYTIHGTNHTLVRKNVAFNTTGHTYYLEDGGEMFNTIEHNIAIKVAVLGDPAGGSVQDGEVFTENAEAILPADHTASGFYLSNAHNWVRGNAASGGWAGYSFPVFDTCLKLSSHLTVIPKAMPVLEFDGNTCHSTGHHWGAAGCVYAGGRLWFENGKGKYTNGRIAHPTMTLDGKKNAWQNISNFRAWLTQKGYSSWGQRVDITNMECHDCTRTAVLFGESSVVGALYNAISENRPADLHEVHRTAFQFYDTWVQTMLVNITLRNIYTRPFLNSWERPNAGIVDITHSDIFKPWGISAVRNVRFENSDRRQLLGRDVRESGASRAFNIMDWDGSFVNAPSCQGHIIGSEIDWWDAFDDCWWEPEWPAWVCPRRPGREVVGMDAEFDGLQERLDIQPAKSNNYELTQAQRDQLYIGHISYFGSNAHKKMIITKNHHLATGVSGTGWYMWVSSGLPQTFKLLPQNFPRSAFILLCIDIPSDASVVSITSNKRWGDAQTFAFTAVSSRTAVLNGNGTQYHVSGRHLYLKFSDLFSTYPNAFTRGKVDIYNTMNQASFIEFTLSCPTKQAGRCKIGATPAPPSGIAITTKTCASEAELDPPPLCPDETDLTSPKDPTKNCSDLTWQCSRALPLHCRQSCLPDCKRLATYPYRCSVDSGCEAAEKPPQVADWCAALSSTDHPAATSDPCQIAWCNATAKSQVRLQLTDGAPCNAHDDSGVKLGGSCSRKDSQCVAVSQAGENVTMQPLAADVAKSVEAVVTVAHGTVTGVTAHYRLAHEAKGTVTPARIVPSPRSGAMACTKMATAGAPNSYHCKLQLPTTTLPTGSRVAGNVTLIVVSSAFATSTLTVTDWASTAHVNPVVDQPAFSEGTLSFVVKPIDFVATVELRVVNPANKAVVVGTVPTSSVSFTADDRAVLTLTAGQLPALKSTEALAALVTTTSGATIQTTLPCVPTVVDEGASCSTAVVDVRAFKPACRMYLQAAGGFNKWWFSASLSASEAAGSFPAFTELRLVQASANTTVPKGTWTYGANPAKDLVAEPAVAVAVYADGAEDVFELDQHDWPKGRDAHCIRGPVSSRDPFRRPDVPVPAAAGACVARRCVAGRAPFVATPAPPPPTTTATVTTTTAAAMSTTTAAAATAATGDPASTVAMTSSAVQQPTTATTTTTVSAAAAGTTSTPAGEQGAPTGGATVTTTSVMAESTTALASAATGNGSWTPTAHPSSTTAVVATMAPTTPAPTLSDGATKALYTGRIDVAGPRFGDMLSNASTNTALKAAVAADLATLLGVADASLIDVQNFTATAAGLQVDFALPPTTGMSRADASAAVAAAESALGGAAQGSSGLIRTGLLYAQELDRMGEPASGGIVTVSSARVTFNGASAIDEGNGSDDDGGSSGTVVAVFVVFGVLAAVGAVAAGVVVMRRRRAEKDHMLEDALLDHTALNQTTVVVAGGAAATVAGDVPMAPSPSVAPAATAIKSEKSGVVREPSSPTRGGPQEYAEFMGTDDEEELLGTPDDAARRQRESMI